MGTMTAALEKGVNPPKADARAGKYLMFWLGSEEFAIQVLRVREIMGVREINTVPQTPAYVKGVINLRGKVIPVVDLRLKFGLEPLAEACAESGSRRLSGDLEIGVIVDAVSEVLTLQASDIEDTPDFGSGVAIPYLLGMAKVKGQVKILVDINRVLPVQEAASLGSL
jgi:purine-binding chemotaxis protein CheW